MTKTLLIILVNLLLSAPGLAAVYTTTASGGNVSAGTSFTGGVAPNCVSGTDQVIVVAGATLYFDINCQLGSTSAIGLGLRVQGAAGNPGLAVVNTGITVTLNGADKSTNANLQVDRYGEFYPQAGATILMGCPNDNACAFVINGLIEDDIYGNSSPVTWSVPSAQINWNNAQGAFTPSNLSVFDGYLYPNIYVARMAQPWISNSSGTGLGTVGNSSISGFRVISNCTGCFTHEVGTWTAVTSTGAYYVNYDTGTLFFYDSAHSNPTFSVNGNKYLSFNSGSIPINANTSYNEGVFTNSVFRYLGSSTPGNDAVLVFGNKQSDTISGGTHRRMKVTNSTFQFTKGPIMVSAYSQGSSADPLLVDSNVSYQISPYASCNGTCGFITLNNAGADYLTVSNNDVRSVQLPGVQPEGLLNCYGLSTYKSSVGDQVINNVVEGGFSLVTAYQVNLCGFPGLLADGNATNGYGYAYSTSNVGTIEGSAANLATVSNNYFGHPYRVLNYDRYMNFTGNVIDGSVHHGFIAAEFADWLSEGVSITGNIFVNAPADTCMQTGYAARTLIDNLTYANNTCVLTQTGSYLAGIFDFTDSRDAGTSNSPVALTTNLMVYNNLAVSERVSWGRYADDQYGMSRVQLGVADWNDDFAPAVSDYCAGLTDGNGANPHGCTLNRLATFTMGTSEYNTNGSRNVTGVTLANPSSSATQSGRSLVWSYTNPANVKLAWGGGPSLQVAHYSNVGVVSGGHQTYNVNNRSGYIVDSGQSFDTRHDSSGACEGSTCTPDPTGEWIILTSGRGAGQIRRITNNCNTLNQNIDASCKSATSRTMEVVPDWTTVPDSTTTYVTWYSELQLFDSGGTNWVSAAVNPWSLATEDGSGGVPSYQTPTTSKTDSGIGVAFHMSNINPYFQNFLGAATTPANCNLATWNSDTQGGASSEDAAMASLRANKTLIKSSLLPYLRGCYTPVLTTAQGNCSLATGAYGGSYFGAVVPNTTGCN